MATLTQRKQQLTKRLAELETRLTGIETELDAPMTQDWEDRAGEREGDEVLESMGNSGLREMAMITAALERVSDKTYGICVHCEEDILPERLDLLPHTPLCRTCANRLSDT